MLRILCFFGIHNWIINKWIKYKNPRSSKIEEGFDRECQWCPKRQRLEKPKKYHPLKYVWTDLKKEDQ